MNAKHCIAMGLFASVAQLASAAEPVIGLITKTETNPFFVKMKEGAQQAAKQKGAKLLTGAGKADGDNAGQVTAIENMVSAGAYEALKAAGKEKGVMIVSIDGGCAGVRDVKANIIAATSQQYPLKMAALGVDAGVAYASTGKKVSGYVDTGVTLISDRPQAGVESRDTAFGLSGCWGK